MSYLCSDTSRSIVAPFSYLLFFYGHDRGTFWFCVAREIKKFCWVVLLWKVCLLVAFLVLSFCFPRPRSWMRVLLRLARVKIGRKRVYQIQSFPFLACNNNKIHTRNYKRSQHFLFYFEKYIYQHHHGNSKPNQ